MVPGLNTLGAAEIARRIAAGETSAEAVMEACIARITERDLEIGAFIEFDADRALASARAADRSETAGPLHGVPFAIKDIIDTVDFATGWGSPIYEGHQPPRNASCVEQFQRAGAIAVGKTVTTEFAYFHPGVTANPHNRDHTPGGSSSGSAASVADRMVPLAFGSQTAASLIRPAAYCGVLGYKASHGAFDLQGVMGLAPSLDTLGLLAREVEDLVLARSVLCGRSDRVPPDFDETPPRIALMRGPHWWDGSIEMRDVCQRALDHFAARSADVGELTHPEVFDRLTEHQATVMAFEAARSRIFEYSRYRDRISPQFCDLVETGLAVTRDMYLNALAERSRAMRQLETLFLDVDVILAPSAPGEAPEGLSATGDPLYSRGWTLLQVPCVSIPAGRGPKGLPLSVQAVGPLGNDDRLLAAVAWMHRQLREFI
ncbi:MAG: amidase [Alphaproteobacteria bacterium]|nr:amidase [Alphaproteobacteria bacterium]